MPTHRQHLLAARRGEAVDTPPYATSVAAASP